MGNAVTWDRLFPRNLLDADIDTQLQYFEEVTVAHRNLKQVDKALKRHIRHAGNRKAVLVIGPTGAGKTKLMERTTEYLLDIAASDPQMSPGRIPVATMEAFSSTKRGVKGYDWNNHGIQGMEALDEILIKYKKKTHRQLIVDELGNVTGSEDVSLTPIDHFMKALKWRNPYAFMIDEAQRMAALVSGDVLKTYMDIIQGHIQRSKVLHILFGTHDLCVFNSLSAQFSRRTKVFHLARYRAESKEDMDEFGSILFSFQRHLPVEQEPDLISHIEYFYDACFGCIGILKDWLYFALVETLEEGARTVTRDICDLHRDENDAIVARKHDILRGEQDFWKLSRMLHYPRRSESQPSSSSAPNGSKKGSGGNPKPGQRGLGRDKVRG